MLQANVSLGCVQPSVTLFKMLHGSIKVVEKFVSQEGVIKDIPLPSGVVVRVVVPGTREVEPFRVAEFITLKVEVAFTTQSVSEESDHFVEGKTALNDGGKVGECRHVSIELFITEPHEK